MWTTSTRLFWTTSAFIVAHMTTSVAFICYRLYNLGRIFIYSDIPGRTVSHSIEQTSCTPSIGLYRDVWIAAIASSRTSLATLMGVMCNKPQCELRSLRVNSGMLNVLRIVTYYTLPPLESPYSSWIAMAFSR